MSSPRDNTASHESGAGRSSGNAPPRNPPLVIVSERGRHSEASRRIVRAQAARASAAQSRETRARNREDRHAREGRDAPQSPAEHGSTPTTRNQPILVTRSSSQAQTQQQQQPFRYQSPSQSRSQDPSTQQDNQDDEGKLKPLVNWITNILHLSAATFAAGAAAVLVTAGRPRLGNANDATGDQHRYIADSGLAMDNVEVTGGLLSRRLPIALPKGFANLQKRISLSDGFLVLLSRTACFDYGSPGVENRLNSLLFDIVMTTATITVAQPGQMANHPIQSHLRLACACLTIFQGQRADGATFAGNEKYNLGFRAAWSEAMKLDQDALKEPKSAEAALWAVFIICVTCGSTITFFHRVLYDLMASLQLQYWEQVRNVLLDFIYPGSFLDEPCRAFYHKLQAGQPPIS
ncbi:hypothetical protein AC578_7962 [Pseudocercospora eumusae]|uniref:Uncharacterized protein n=1 Tax=Pseudocercospora eumusae TaxID=321146 RepID=A0A139HPA4_9PEZI|nr:hypothetical protein AC578_7962 [Pseudocercospora eumusae]